ncbi:hypothetical protein cyc_04259 [Cyclospora cayetanensis]|uniref:Uncharacterized protein n=1 Tax=Cyclospora cayetanensis TaxID=88456 RepID=A0A1D3CZQ1_9EIME|nr:hypothetical protein cyc_04259 [Cyclospora cayetanensis]
MSCTKTGTRGSKKTEPNPEEVRAENMADQAEKDIEAEIDISWQAIKKLKSEFLKEKENIKATGNEKRMKTEKEDTIKTQERDEAEASVKASIEHQRTLQNKRLETLPTLLTEAVAPMCHESPCPPPSAAADGRESQPPPKLQQKLQQLDTLMKSVGLEELLLNEFKNLKKDEEALFAEDAKRKEQHFVDCIADQKEELKATVAIMNAEYASLKQQADAELLRLEQVMLSKRKAVLRFQRYLFPLSGMVIWLTVQELEVHLESLLAAYHLNQEKLNYNVQLLTERNAANAAALAQHRGSVAGHTLGESTQTLRLMRIQTSAFVSRLENVQATTECRRLWQQYEELGKAATQKKKVDQTLFKQLWKHHEQEVSELVRDVLNADRFIHDHYLGIDYREPQEETERREVLPGIDYFDVECCEDTTSRGRGSSSSYIRTCSRKTESSQLQERKGSSSNPNDGSPFPASKIYKALLLMKQTCGFLLDACHREPPEHLTEEQRAFLQIMQLLELIGVESKDDLFILIDLFYKGRCGEVVGAACGVRDALCRPGQDLDDDALYTEADDVLTVLEAFQDAKAATEFDLAQRRRDRRKGKGDSRHEASERLKREIRRHWSALPNPLPPSRQRVWELLLSAYCTYFSELQRRSCLMQQLLDQQVSAAVLQQLLTLSGAAPLQQKQQPLLPDVQCRPPGSSTVG